jgi:hypothetical protein
MTSQRAACSLHEPYRLITSGRPIVALPMKKKLRRLLHLDPKSSEGEQLTSGAMWPVRGSRYRRNGGVPWLDGDLFSVSNLSAHLPCKAMRYRTPPRPVTADKLVQTLPRPLRIFAGQPRRRPDSYPSSGSVSLLLGHTWGMLASAVAMYCSMTVTTRACMAGVMCR